jgi:uncharacterized membrane protein
MRVGRRFHLIARRFHLLLAFLHVVAAVVLFVTGRFRWIPFHIIAAFIDRGAVSVHDRAARKDHL